MRSVASVLEAPEPAASPAAQFTPLGRAAAAGTLVLGAALQLAAFLTIPDHDETVDRLRWVAANPDQADASKLFDVLAMPFLFGTVLVYVLLSRRRSPRLAYAGGVLLGCGMVGLSMLQGFETLEFAIASDGRIDPARIAGAVDDISSAPAIAMLLLFLPGVFFGLLTMAVALWRSGAVPRGAVLLIPAFMVTDIFLQQGVAGHAIALVGAAWIASAVLLTPPTRPSSHGCEPHPRTPAGSTSAPRPCVRTSVHDNDRPARARQRLPRTRAARPRRPLRPHRARDRDACARRDRAAHRRRQLPPARARHLAARPPRERARPDRPPRRRRRALPARPRRGARLARTDLRRPRDRVRRSERVLALPGRSVGRSLHDRPAGDPRRHRPDGHRPRRPLAVTAHLGIPHAAPTYGGRRRSPSRRHWHSRSSGWSSSRSASPTRTRTPGAASSSPTSASRTSRSPSRRATRSS